MPSLDGCAAAACHKGSAKPLLAQWNEIKHKYDEPSQTGRYLPTKRFRYLNQRFFTWENFKPWYDQVYRRLQDSHNQAEFVKAITIADEKFKFRRFRVEHPNADLFKNDTNCIFSLFSIISLLHQGQRHRILLTGFIADVTGAFGVVKVGFPITEQGGSFKLHFNHALAVKISAQTEVVDKALIAQEAVIWQKLYPRDENIFYHYREKAVGYDKHYTVEPLLNGCNLRLFLQRYVHRSTKDYSDTRPRLNLRDIINLFIAIINAIKLLHDKGYVHCDIKSENIMVYVDQDKNFHVVIVDMNLVCQAGVRILPRGTEAYRAPEWKASMPVGFEKDIYSLGVVFAEILCDFEKDPIQRIVKLNKIQDNPNIETWLRPIKNIITTMLNPKQPSKRPALHDIMRVFQDVVSDLKAYYFDPALFSEFKPMAMLPSTNPAIKAIVIPKSQVDVVTREPAAQRLPAAPSANPGSALLAPRNSPGPATPKMQHLAKGIFRRCTNGCCGCCSCC